MARMESICPDCGAATPDGRAGCQAMVDALWALEFSDFRFARAHRMGVDAYALQHPDRCCASSKSLAAHLGGLCCAFEHAESPHAMKALHRWLNSRPEVEKPELPLARGALTVADVSGILEPRAYDAAVEQWARSAWEAYAALHPVARRWIEAALARRPRA